MSDETRSDAAKAARRAPKRPTAEELFAGRPNRRARFEAARYALEAAHLIRQYRLRAGIDQKELARRLGVSQPRISQLERGEGVDGPGYGIVRQVAEACGGDWHDPLTGEVSAAEMGA